MSLPNDLIRRGWDSEVERHRENLERELADIARYLEQARADLNAGKVNTHVLREIVRGGAEAYHRGAALAALNSVRFALPEDGEPR
jgi:hypothetical protein